MGTRRREFIGLDADEWLAYYQYWVGAKVAKGPMKDAVIAEQVQHTTEELTHADLVSNRIIQLGGTPLTTPKEWFKWTNCGYEAPDDAYVGALLEQYIKGEQCAISVYDKLMKMTEGKAPITYNIALQIIEQEVEHEEDLQSLLEDLELMLRPPK